MEYMKSLWREKYERLDFRFEGREAILVRPERPNGKWLLKTEYFSAFQDMEEELVRRGFSLAYLKNINRWGIDADMDAKKRFRDFLVDEFGLSSRCVPVGMSCGGLHAVKLAARHPGMVSCLYLDAPVINLNSCPMSYGKGMYKNAIEEMLNALSLTPTQFMSYREHPLDKLPKLISCEIPAALVCGDSDGTVPFEENGLLVKQAYESTDIPFIFELKTGCDHHPHGPFDTERIVSFIEKYA